MVEYRQNNVKIHTLSIQQHPALSNIPITICWRNHEGTILFTARQGVLVCGGMDRSHLAEHKALLHNTPTVLFYR